MTFRLFLTPQVLDQAEEVEFYYESLSAGLGDRFTEHFYTLLQRLEDNPFTWQAQVKNIRRALIPNFPYAVFFRVQEESRIEVLCLLHQSADPGKWPS